MTIFLFKATLSILKSSPMVGTTKSENKLSTARRTNDVLPTEVSPSTMSFIITWQLDLHGFSMASFLSLGSSTGRGSTIADVKAKWKLLDNAAGWVENVNLKVSRQPPPAR